jgi:predicted phage terminase large subunit-like protein
MYAHLLRHDLSAFIHRSFLELNPQTQFHSNWHIEVVASKLEDVRHGRCRRLIVNVPPRHLKSHAISVVFPAWLLGHEPSKQILSVTYAQDLSETLARGSRSLMGSAFYQALFDTRLSREAISDFATTEGGYRFSTSVEGVLTGRGADVIIIDDPLKADDAVSEPRRRSVNEWFANTLRSRLNNQETGAIIIVMQRLHADDLVAHVQESERWDVLSFPVIAEQDEPYSFQTPYGRRRVHRRAGEILQPALFSAASLEVQRRGMTDYNFVAQYQQNPQPQSGIIVKREWLKFYSSDEKPDRFDQILQSWDTANKDTELANFSVCTTWGVKDRSLYLLDVFRRKMDFPELKRAISELAKLHDAKVVLIEDKASGTSLIQELRADNFSTAQPAPKLEGDKVMRLHAQTAKIEGGFVQFPKEAPWLDTYLRELLSFPNAKNDDQVDSTVFALAWISEHPEPGLLTYYKKEARRITNPTLDGPKKLLVRIPGTTTHYCTCLGRTILIPADRIVEVTEEEYRPALVSGCAPIRE